MKYKLFNRARLNTLVLTVFFFVFSGNIISQSESFSSVNLDKLSFGVSGGPSLFWGDIDASGKGNFVGGFHINSRVTTYLENSLSFHRGWLQGEKANWTSGAPANLGFKADFWQIDRIYRFYPLSHSAFSLDVPFSPYIFAGVGLINYKSYKYNTETGKVLDRVGYSSKAFRKSSYVTDLILPFGVGVQYPLNNSFTVFADQKWIYAHTELIDAHVGQGTNKNDWYSLTSIGVNYNLDNAFPGLPSHIITRLFGESFTESMCFGVYSGALLFFGDGSQPRPNVLGKLLDYQEREMGAGIFVEKPYTERIHLKLNASFGQLTGIRETWTNSKRADFYFKNKFFDISLSQKFVFVNPEEKNYSIYASAGLGIISYRSAAYDLNSDEILRTIGYKYENGELVNDSRRIDPILPFAIGVELHTPIGVSLFAEQKLTYAHSDLLDAWKGRGSGINDFYSFTSIGVKYCLSKLERSFYAQ